MNLLLMAWESTIEDVENVLNRMGEDIALAPDIFQELDCEAVAKAALRGFGMEEQTAYAYDEIQDQIKEYLNESH